MKTPWQLAIENALSFDVKKDGLQQRQNGDWTLRLTVAEIDMHQVIVSAKMGTIFQCVLVEKGDDELPVDHRAMERDKWRDLGPAKQAGIRCKEPSFWAFLSEECAGPPIHDEAAAAVMVRDICGVESRADLNKPGNSEARIAWHELDRHFQAWKAAEHA
jgi:hypothetical protein